MNVIAPSQALVKGGRMASERPESYGLDASEGPEPRSWLRTGVVGTSSASFVAGVGVEIPTALLPSLLTSSVGAPASALGLIDGLSDGFDGVARLAGGAFANDPDRCRRTAVGGYFTSSLLAAAVGAATSAWHVGVLWTGAWVTRGLRMPARNTMIADLARPAVYGRVYGFARAMDNLGAIVGTLLAMVLVSMVGVRWAIGLSAVPGLIATLMTITIRRRAAFTPAPRPVRVRIRPVLRAPGMTRLFGALAAMELGNCAAALLILRATELLALDRSGDQAATAALSLYVVYSAAATAAGVPAGYVTDRRSPRLVLMIGAVALIAAYVGFGRDATSWLELAPWFIIGGIGLGCVETAEHAAVAMRAAPNERGSVFGLLAALQGLSNFTASALAGILWTALGPAWAFTYLGGAMGLGIFLLGTTRPAPHLA